MGIDVKMYDSAARIRERLMGLDSIAAELIALYVNEVRC